MSEENKPSEKGPEKENHLPIILAVSGVCIVGVIAIMVLQNRKPDYSSYSPDRSSRASEWRPEPPPPPPPERRIQEPVRAVAPPPPPPPPAPSEEEQAQAEAYQKGVRLGQATANLVGTAVQIDEEEKQRKAAGKEDVLQDFKNGYNVGKAILEFAEAIDNIDTSSASTPKSLFVPPGWVLAEKKRKVNDGYFELGGIMLRGTVNTAIAAQAFYLTQDPLLSLQQFLAKEKGMKPLTALQRDNDARCAFVTVASPDGSMLGVIYMANIQPWTYLFIAGWPQDASEVGGHALGSVLQGMFGG